MTSVRNDAVGHMVTSNSAAEITALATIEPVANIFAEPTVVTAKAIASRRDDGLMTSLFSDYMGRSKF